MSRLTQRTGSGIPSFTSPARSKRGLETPRLGIASPLMRLSTTRSRHLKGNKTMKIKVTNLNIYCGAQKNMAVCPIALAMKDAGLINVEVSKFSVRFRRPGPTNLQFTIVLFPPEVRSFIKRFDQGSTVNAFTFEI